ncbi:U3 small nucleolar RNA-associated protein [Dinochytrium kinnereticum]|nr:U3 small nucleolar RNA-associated protein [Dinochytrium kinnereticum]
MDSNPARLASLKAKRKEEAPSSSPPHASTSADDASDPPTPPPAPIVKMVSNPNTTPVAPRSMIAKRSILFHRCRFVDHMPSAINALAFSKEPVEAVPGSSSKDRVLLACARENGDLEIWNPARWHLERVIPGIPGATIESIVWIRPSDTDSDSDEEMDADDASDSDIKPIEKTRESFKKTGKPTRRSRLLTAGLDGCITEWDLTTLMPIAKVESGGGAIWCLAASPRHDEVAIGCEDGTVRVFSVEGTPGTIEYKATFDRQDGRILSVAYHPTQPILSTGSTDSCIRTYSTTTRRCLSRSTLDTANHEETLVWAITYLPDGTLVSGDSLGTVTFWDGHSRTIKRSLRPHAADVLCLAVGEKGDVIYSSGIDRKVVQYRLVEAPVGSGGVRRGGGSGIWVVSGDRRFHSHDVRALALCEARPVDAIVSGGVDTILTVTTSVSSFPHSKQIRHNPFPQKPIVSVAEGARLVMCRYSDRVKVWALGEAQRGVGIEELRGGERVGLESRHRLLADIRVKRETNLTAATISSDGKLIAVSDLYTTKLFRLSIPPSTTPSTPFSTPLAKSKKKSQDALARVTRVKEFPSPTLLPGSLSLCFTPDGRRLVMGGSDGFVRVVDVSEGGTFETVAVFGQHREGGGEVVDCLAFVGVHHATLPRFSTLHTAISFHPTSPILTVTTCSNELYIYDAEDRRLTDWSREYSHRLPERFVNRNEIIMGIATPVLRKGMMMVWAGSYVCSIDLEQPIGPRDAPITVGKRKRPWTYMGGPTHAKSKPVLLPPSTPTPTPTPATTTTKSPRTSDPNVIVIESESEDEVEVGEVGGRGIVGVEVGGKRVATASSFSMEHRYGPLMYFGFMGEGEAVAVEMPLLTVVERLPPGFYRKRYGS